MPYDNVYGTLKTSSYIVAQYLNKSHQMLLVTNMLIQAFLCSIFVSVCSLFYRRPCNLFILIAAVPHLPVRQGAIVPLVARALSLPTGPTDRCRLWRDSDRSSRRESAKETAWTVWCPV